MPDESVPVYLRPFVLEPPSVVPLRDRNLDLYLPGSDAPSPAVLFVHGGPIPEGRKPSPRDWPVYQGYGAAAAERGLVGAVVDHRLHSFDLIVKAAEDVVGAVDRLRCCPEVDADRIALWFFSAGGVLMGTWLRQPPTWLRCVAASYPVCPPQDELGLAATAPREAVRDAGDLAILLTRAGVEEPARARWVKDFIASARETGANLDVLDVPHGQHAFDVLDHTDESRIAVGEALGWVRAHLVD